MKYIYAVCLLALVPVTASAAEPKWIFRSKGVQRLMWDTASVQWPNPQYRGQLKIEITCHQPGSDGILADLDTGEHLEDEYATIPLPLRHGNGESRIDAMIAGTSLYVSDYDEQIRFLDALRQPGLSIEVTDSKGRHVVTTPVPSSGIDAALRKLSCLSRYFYEYEQRTKAQPTLTSVCGNGKVEAAEVCDDGNQTGSDGCEPDCTRPAQQPGSAP
jgi:cysteine-rich repeat protein